MSTIHAIFESRPAWMRPGANGTLAALLVLPMLLLSPLAKAEVLFEDGFESGDRSASQNGFSWGGGPSTSVTTNNARSGNYSLRFVYDGASSGSDGWAEQRFELGNQWQELWFQYDLYVPDNYRHRNETPGNNKFIAIYRDPYKDPGFQINLSLTPNGSGGSDLDIHRYNYGVEISQLHPSAGQDILTSSDQGKWYKLTVHVRVPSSGGAADGAVQVWKNDRQVANYNAVAMYGGDGENYFDEAYLLGWANSGYAERTVFYIDNVLVSDTPPDGISDKAPPSPPADVDVSE